MGITWIEPVEITPGSTESWIDVDVSSYVVEGTTGVILHTVRNSSYGSGDFRYRKNGSTDDRHAHMDLESHFWVTCGVDENRILELYIGSSIYIDIYIVGYFDSCAVFITNATDISVPEESDGWIDVDINVDDGAIGAFVEIYNSGTSPLGLRKNGSTDNRIDQMDTKLNFGFVGLDGNEIFEAYYAQWTEGSYGSSYYLYLKGYIKSGATFLTNGTELEVSVENSYVDLTQLPSGSTGGFIEVLPTIFNYALRKNGSSEDIFYNFFRHCWSSVECDTNRLIEGKVRFLDSGSFYLIGYLTGSTTTSINVYNGSSWTTPTAVKYYNGSSWVDVTAVKVWDGVTWITI